MPREDYLIGQERWGRKGSNLEVKEEEYADRSDQTCLKSLRNKDFLKKLDSPMHASKS